MCSRLSCGRTTVLAHRFARKAKRMFASAASASMPASASIAAVSSRTDETADSGRSSLRAISSSHSTIFVAAKRAGTDACSAYGSMMCAVAWMQRRTAPSGSCSCALAGQKSMRPGASSKRATCRAWSISSSTPSFFAAEMGTTGMPSSASSSFTRTVPPFASTSSIMLSASTMGIPSSMICISAAFPIWRPRIFFSSTIHDKPPRRAGPRRTAFSRNRRKRMGRQAHGGTRPPWIGRTGNRRYQGPASAKSPAAEPRLRILVSLAQDSGHSFSCGAVKTARRTRFRKRDREARGAMRTRRTSWPPTTSVD